MARSRRPLWLLALVLLGAGGGIWWWRAHRAKTTTASKPDDKAGPGNERGPRPSWAADPDAPPGAIEGIVLDPSGKPHDGALVAVVPADSDAERFQGRQLRPAGVTRSSGGGHFRIENLRPGPYAATATAAGFAAGFKGQLQLLPGETLRGVEIRLEKGGVTLSGHVTDSGGGPVSAADVRAHRIGKDSGDVFQVVADGQGAYKITIPKGEYMLAADAEGYAPDEKYVRATLDQTLDFKLNPAATLRGRVVMRDGGAPVAGAEVTIGSSELWWMNAKKATSDAQGIFEFKDLDPGDYDLSAQKGPLVGHLPRKVGVTLAGFTGDVTIQVDRARIIAGHVRAQNGSPVGGAKIRLGEGPWGSFGGRLRAESAKDGTYKIEGVLPGKYQVFALAEGKGPGRVEDLIVADRDLNGVDITMPDGAEVSGRVVDKDGQGVAGAAVRGYVTSGGGMWGARSWASDRTGADGSFKLKDLSVGQLHIDADHPDHGHATLESPLPISAGDKKEVTLTMTAGGSISGTVKWDDGTAASAISVSGFSRTGGMAQTRSAPDGSYTLSPLGKGTVVVSASRKDGGFMMGPAGGGSDPKFITLGPNERKSGVDLMVLRGGHKITGVVLAPDGKPVEGAGVSATREIEGQAYRMRVMGMGADTKVYSQSDGTFTVDDLAIGSYTVTASKSGYPDAQAQHIPADQTGVRIQLKPESVVAGIATSSNGKPVADYTLSVMPSVAATAADRMAQFMGGPNKQTVHDPAGAFEIHGLAAGTYDLVAMTSDNHAGRLGGVTLGDGEQKSGLRVTIQMGTTLRGRVIEYGTGAPIANANVMVGGGVQPLNAKTDAQGSFKVDGLAPGRTVSLVTMDGMPMMDSSSHVMDAREITIADGKDTVDVAPIKLVKGDWMQRADGDTGIRARNVDGRAIVDTVLDKSPAAHAGIRPGDAIQAIDGKDCSDLGPIAIGLWLGGAVGSQVQVVINGRPITLTRIARPPGS